jgi:NADH-quinone oxidoreductase subunit N
MNDPLAWIANGVHLILPEVVLLATVCIMLFAAPFLVSERGEAPTGLRHRWGALALLAWAVAAAFWWQTPLQPQSQGPFRLDELTWFVRGLTLIVGAVMSLMQWNQADDSRSAECQACLLAIGAGANLTSAANDLVLLFLGLELISIPTYLFLIMPRRDAPAQEATLKYFLLSMFSSALTLFGMSYLYGVTGTTNLESLYDAFRRTDVDQLPSLAAIAEVLLIAGLGFRITAVPFHFYAPDVFQGCQVTGAALLSVVPKIAGFTSLIRLLIVPLPIAHSGWLIVPATESLLWWLAVLTMFAGNLLALVQSDVRRMLAYSSVSHAGYLLVGLTVGLHVTTSPNGLEALAFYLAVYGVMTLGAFAALAASGRPDRKLETIDDLAGLVQTRPATALMLCVCLFSLTGLPPTAGFLGKLNLFLAAWNLPAEGALRSYSGQWLAVLLAINAAIGAGYYLRLIAAVMLRDPIRTEVEPIEAPSLVALTLCASATLALFVAPGWLWWAAQRI